MEIFTIGFTQTTAAHFFGRLSAAGIRRLVDVRLNNTSQLAGWAKSADLPFFLQELVGAEYIHEPLLAPTPDILKAYRKEKGDWIEYERAFYALMAQRQVETLLSPTLFAIPSVLLCSEATAEPCHRRLALEYLNEKWGDIVISHL